MGRNVRNSTKKNAPAARSPYFPKAPKATVAVGSPARRSARTLGALLPPSGAASVTVVATEGASAQVNLHAIDQ